MTLGRGGGGGGGKHAYRNHIIVFKIYFFTKFSVLKDDFLTVLLEYSIFCTWGLNLKN